MQQKVKKSSLEKRNTLQVSNTNGFRIERRGKKRGRKE
jgi:hypothetical protein